MPEPFVLGAVYVGWPKCGSTWLFKFLSADPSVIVAPQKDTRYFDENYAKGRTWLERQYRNSGPLGHRSVAVDIGHDYIFSREAIGRLSTEPGNPRILVGLRDPASWLVSEYRYVVGTGRVEASFSEYLRKYPYALEHARFENYIERLRETIDPKRIEYLLLEDLASDATAYADRIARLLNFTRDVTAYEPARVVNQQSRPRSSVVLNGARAVSAIGERMGMARAVQIAKRSQMRRLVFKPDRQPVDASLGRDIAGYADQFRRTTAAVSELTGRDLSAVWTGHARA